MWFVTALHSVANRNLMRLNYSTLGPGKNWCFIFTLKNQCWLKFWHKFWPMFTWLGSRIYKLKINSKISNQLNIMSANAIPLSQTQLNRLSRKRVSVQRVTRLAFIAIEVNSCYFDRKVYEQSWACSIGNQNELTQLKNMLRLD